MIGRRAGMVQRRDPMGTVVELEGGSRRIHGVRL